MTKEEILNASHWKYVVEKGVSSIHTPDFPAAYKEQAEIAMDEYAKQIAIAFAIHYNNEEDDRMEVRYRHFIKDNPL